MGRQARAKKTNQFGKGKVTPVQIAYIVDQYLSENLFTQTRSSFRSEASTLISKITVQEGPKGLMSLETIIDEYVSIKEQKMEVEMEKMRLEQERLRVQTLLQGMQNAMNAYNAFSPVVAAAGGVPALVPAQVSENASPAGQIVNVSSNVRQPWVVSNMLKGATSFTTPMVANPSSKKRQGSNMVPCAPINPKKSCTRMPNKQLTDGSSQQGIPQQSTFQSSTSGCVANLMSVQGSSVAKVLFHKTTSSKSVAQNSSSPTTPPLLPSAQSDKNASPVGHSSSTNSSSKTTPHDFSSNCTVVSTKTIIVSPCKKETYYSVEKHCSSICSPATGDFEKAIKRDHVKGRLNFDSVDEMRSLEKTMVDESSTSESDDANIVDLDMPNMDFNMSDLLLDFDMHCEELDAYHQPGLNPCSVETVSSGHLALAETSSTTMTQVFSSTTDSCTAMKLVSKCIKIPSPAKYSSPVQDNQSS